MIVYIDYIFIENLIMNYLLLFETKNIVKERTKVIKITLASIIGSIYVCSIYLLKFEFLNYSIFKLLLSFVMIYITFKPKKISIYLKEIFIFYFVSIINTGTCLVIVSMFNLNVNSRIVKILLYSIGYVFVCIINNQVWKMFKIKLKKSKLVYDVYLNDGNKYVAYKGFVDTGNTSKELYTGRAIFYANKKDGIDLTDREKVIIKVNTINGKNVIVGYMFDNVIIKKEEFIKFTDVVICFTEEEIKNKLECDMIINYETYEELLGGIYI